MEIDAIDVLDESDLEIHVDVAQPEAAASDYDHEATTQSTLIESDEEDVVTIVADGTPSVLLL
jgi:hypothetical protein